MSYQRVAYGEQDSAGQMHLDCAACTSSMAGTRRRVDVGSALGEAPRIRFEAFPRDVAKPTITVSDATAHLAARLHLHLD